MNFYCIDNLAEYIKGLYIQNDEGLLRHFNQLLGDERTTVYIVH